MPSTSTYVAVRALGDFGPWIEKLIVELPAQVGENDVDAAAFNVFCEHREQGSAEPVTAKAPDGTRVPTCGYIDPVTAYPCDSEGGRIPRGSRVAIELSERELSKSMAGGIPFGRLVDVHFRITQLRPLPAEPVPVSGLQFDTCENVLTPALVGWRTGVARQAVDGVALKYGYFEPPVAAEAPKPLAPFAKPRVVPAKAPLIVWLHGAGEGGGNVELPLVANRVTALSQANIQGQFDGAAWVLVPQCPTFWMDDGVEKMGRSNKSIYTAALKALIDEFVAAHADRLDASRIVIGGLSNGGFMTLRMCIDYPGLFSAGIPCCAPFFRENQTADVLAALAKTPLWFVHARRDELVDPADTVLPLVAALRAAGAEAHMTYFDRVKDLTGRYREADGRPRQIFNHAVWVNLYNDFCHVDLDGTHVLVDGEPVGCWSWAARQRARWVTAA